MNQEQRRRLSKLAREFLEGRDQSKAAAGEIEFLLDEEFPDDDEMQDYVSDLACYTPGGGDHLQDEKQIGAVVEAILRRIAADQDIES
jgi:hypothetical protein